MRKEKSIPGLYLRNGIWTIDKEIDGKRVCKSTRTGNFEEAKKYLIHLQEQARLAKVYGVRPKRTFQEAATKYIQENQDKKSIVDDIWALDTLLPYIGHEYIDEIHMQMESLKNYIKERQNGKFAEKVKKGIIKLTRCKEKVTNQTINAALKLIRHILNLAAEDWRDEYQLTWLANAPKIKELETRTEIRKAIPLSWEEQDRLFAELSSELQRMALFAVNTGARDREICRLKWEWEIPIPQLNTSVFLIPAKAHKNKHERLIVLNDIAKEIIEEVRGIDPVYVFTYDGKPYYRMMATSWRKGRKRAGLPHVRVHDLKHTFGTRLTNAGVSLEIKKQLLGHKGREDITTHYSLAGIFTLYEAANRVCKRQDDISVAAVRLRQLSNINNIIPLFNQTGLSSTAPNEAFNESRKSPARFLQEG